MIERLLIRHRNRRLLALGACGLVLGLAGAIALASSDPIAQLLGLSVGLVALVLTALLAYLSVWWTLAGMPLAASTRRHGSPGKVLRAIDGEIAAGRDVVRLGDIDGPAWAMPDFVVLTPSWLVQVNAAGLAAVRLDDILWIFRRVRQVGGIWGLVHWSHGVRVYYRPDRWEVMPLRPDLVDALLDEIVRRQPWVLTGHYDDIAEMAAADPRQLAAEVERRRGEWAALDEAGRDARLAAQRRELGTVIQQLKLRDRDPCADDGSGRARQRAVERRRRGRSRDAGDAPERALNLRRVLVAEWVRLATMVAALALIVGFWCYYLTQWRKDPIGQPLDAAVAGLAMTACIAAYVVYRYGFRSFLWDLRRQLARLGPRTSVMRQINDDVNSDSSAWIAGIGLCWESPTEPIGRQTELGPPRPNFLVLSANWLVEVRPTRASVVCVGEIVWVYLRVVPRAIWLLGPEYNFQLGCRLRDGSERCVGARNEEELDELAERLLAARPELLTGWRGEWHTLRGQGPEALERECQERAARLKALSPAERETWLDDNWDHFRRFVQHVE